VDGGPLSDSRFVDTLDDLEEIELERYPTLPLMRRSYDLRANVTSNDATYIGLAEDRRLARALGTRSAIHVLQQGERRPGQPAPGQELRQSRRSPMASA